MLAKVNDSLEFDLLAEPLLIFNDRFRGFWTISVALHEAGFGGISGSVKEFSGGSSGVTGAFPRVSEVLMFITRGLKGIHVFFFCIIYSFKEAPEDC